MQVRETRRRRWSDDDNLIRRIEMPRSNRRHGQRGRRFAGALVRKLQFKPIGSERGASSGEVLAGINVGSPAATV